MAINFFIPSISLCSLLFSISIANLNNSKSLLFWVTKGYLLKCGIIILVNYSSELTENTALLVSNLSLILPAEK